MTIEITDFESLLLAAKNQAEPQRLLFVFLKVSLPNDHNSEEAARFHARQGGQLQPIMCVDKTVGELGSFADLVAESKHMEKDWQIVLVASLSGKNGVPPSSADATQPLTKMVKEVESGAKLSNYMAFDKTGAPVQFGQ
ncbi:MAG: ribonucleotide reductase subunit alpha [Formosimonas sp.]|jgi:hypothetical protein